jgi:hypothetical protein
VGSPDDAGQDGSQSQADGGKTTGKDGGKGGGKDAGKDTSTTQGPDAGVDATGTHDASDAPAADPPENIPFDASPFDPVDGGDTVITAPDSTWTWIPFAGSLCRDGSTTGIGVNFNATSKNVMIYLEGGGACFNAETCAPDENPSSFGADDLPQRFPENGSGVPDSGNGILDRDNAANPVKDWNFVYVPYCTGDIHAGNNPASTVPGVSGTQAFMGYNNVDLYLQRLVPTFSGASQVLLTGISGGGFGAAANYAHVQRAFGSVPVNLVDDSGPYMEDPYLPTCLQNQVRGLWGLDSTLGADCEGDCNDPQRFFIDFAKHVMKANPARTFGLLDSTDDEVITAFFGFGADNCQGFAIESKATFTAGLDDIRTQLATDTNQGTFIFDSNVHTSLGDPSFYSRTAGGTQLTSWVGGIVAGNVANVGP